MMAISKKIHKVQRAEAEALLPWYVTGALSAREARSLTAALARNPELADQYAAAREEYAETVRMNESLGAPSSRVVRNLFAAIDAESADFHDKRSVRGRSSEPNAPATLKAFLVRLSPGVFAWSTATAVVALLLIGGAIGAFLTKVETAVQY